MHLQTSRKHRPIRNSSVDNTHTKLEVGDVVLVESKKNDGRKRGKLDINFKGGPYTIAEDVGKGQFCLKDAQGKVLKTAINCHRLKIWHDPKEAKLNQKSVSISFTCASSCALQLYDLCLAFRSTMAYHHHNLRVVLQLVRLLARHGQNQRERGMVATSQEESLMH